MDKKHLLARDAVTDAPLPFDPSTTQLHLLGFLMPYDGKLPAPVPMVAAHAGKRYIITHSGEAFLSGINVHKELREPDIRVHAGHTGMAQHNRLKDVFFSLLRKKTSDTPPPTTQVGHIAFALSPDRIFFGQERLVHSQLRRTIDTDSTLSPDNKERILNYLEKVETEKRAVTAWLSCNRTSMDPYFSVLNGAKNKPQNAQDTAPRALPLVNRPSLTPLQTRPPSSRTAPHSRALAR